MASRRLWAQIQEMSEDELRLQILIPLLQATPGFSGITDVHGQNEKGLDVIFMVETNAETLCYGLQLKKGTIAGGGTKSGTVKQIVDQLQLATDYGHPVLTQSGTFTIDRFIVATSGAISATAREEITQRIKPIPVRFWDESELLRRIHHYLPQLFQVADGDSIAYLKSLIDRYDALDAVDQIPGVAKRTLSQVFVNLELRRKYDPGVSLGAEVPASQPPVACLSLMDAGYNAVVIADQDAGKTSLLRMLALKKAQTLLTTDKSDRDAAIALPVLVRAKDILGAALSVVDGIAIEFRRLGAHSLIDTLTADLAVGNYSVLVDGFSELAREEDKDLLARFLEEFCSAYPRVKVIVAARPVDFLTPKYLLTFHQYTIEDFNETQVRELIRRWTSESSTFAEVGQKMVERLREALQLPGSPIPAMIGVMLHEKQGQYITNTAEAIDKYMVIRLGRYAYELGMQQQIEWTKKQDLLAEVAFELVGHDLDGLTPEAFTSRFDDIFARQGESCRGQEVTDELVDSGVLVRDGQELTFHRTSFRDFFAAHHIFRNVALESFVTQHQYDRRWAGAIVFAAGMQRNNSALLDKLAGSVDRTLTAAVGALSDDHYYVAYLAGRVLSNSEGSDHRPRVAALEAVLRAMARSIPGFEEVVTQEYGPVGKLMALIGVEHSFFVTIGVPWLKNQLSALLAHAELTDEERFMLASTYVHLGFADRFDVLSGVLKQLASLRALVAADILIRQVGHSERMGEEEAKAFGEIRLQIARKLKGRNSEINELIKVKSKILDLERQRMRRIMATSSKRT
jgi:hypothetical protein